MIESKVNKTERRRELEGRLSAAIDMIRAKMPDTALAAVDACDGTCDACMHVYLSHAARSAYARERESELWIDIGEGGREAG